MREQSSDRIPDNTKDQRQTTKVFTPLPSTQFFPRINKEYSIPIINQIASQNEYLEAERNMIDSELRKVASLGQYLASQNERLRRHYHQRTCDVNNIMKTIEINMCENTNETNHQIHLLKESNYLIYKNIQQKTKQLRKSEIQIQAMHQEIDVIQGEVTKNENDRLNPMKAKLSSNLNENRIQQLTRTRDRATNEEIQLLSQVEDLIIQTNKLKKQNLLKGQRIRSQSANNMKNKETYREDIVHTLKSLTQLKEEKERIKLAVQRQKQINKQMQDRSQDLKIKIRELTSQQEAYFAKVQKQQFSRERNITRIQKGRKTVAELQVQVLKFVQVKEKHEKQVEQRKRKERDNAIRFKEQRKTIQKTYDDKIKEIRKKIRENDQHEETQLARLKEESRLAEIELQKLRDSHRAYASDIEDYNSIIGKLQNPVTEIERAQMLLRIQGKRGGLQSLSGF